jgi:hypothetical protein
MDSLRDIPLDTPFGTVKLAVTEWDHVYASFRGEWGQSKLTVNGGEVSGGMHYYRQADSTFSSEFRSDGLTREDIYVENARGKPASDATKRKLREVLGPLISAWARKHEGLFEQAQREKLRRERESIERQIAKLEEKLREKFAELYALES